MFALTVRDHLMIAHSLPDEFFGPAQALHGATLVTEVTWFREELDEHGVVLDIGAGSALVRSILDELNYRNLDEHPAFAGILSTTEQIARHVADKILTGMPAVGLAPDGFAAVEVRMREHPDAWASYRRDLRARA